MHFSAIPLDYVFVVFPTSYLYNTDSAKVVNKVVERSLERDNY